MKKLGRGTTCEDALKTALELGCAIEHDTQGDTYLLHRGTGLSFTLRRTRRTDAAPFALVKFLNRLIH